MGHPFGGLGSGFFVGAGFEFGAEAGGVGVGTVVGDGSAVVAENAGDAAGLDGLDGHDFGVLDGLIGAQPVALEDGSLGEDDGAGKLIEGEGNHSEQQDGDPDRDVVVQDHQRVQEDGDVEWDSDEARPEDDGLHAKDEALGGFSGVALRHASCVEDDDDGDEHCCAESFGVKRVHRDRLVINCGRFLVCRATQTVSLPVKKTIQLSKRYLPFIEVMAGSRLKFIYA